MPPAPTTITQNADIRFLGKLLGDVIRTYGGDTLFRRIEYIRATSVDQHRGVAGAATVDRGLDALSLDDTLAFVRGFMLSRCWRTCPRIGRAPRTRRATASRRPCGVWMPPA